MINPYININWERVLYVPSISHEHIDKNEPLKQQEFEGLISGGVKHIALSNYHPSVPWYPLSEHFVVPEDIIGSPNAEFWNMNINALHINGLGSFSEEYDTDPELTWKEEFNKVFQRMQYEDAGGITINHPAYTKAAGYQLKNEDILQMLDYDSRVLGIEIYNATSGDVLPGTSWDLDTWDYILKTGRRCWGFCVPDHDGQNTEENHQWRGRNILLCSEFSEYECLKAYKEGRFYGSIYNTDLKFSNIAFNNGVINVSAPNADYINIVVDGVYSRINNNTVEYNISSSATYIRVEAHNNENSIFSNPIILHERIKEDSTAKKMLILDI